ncbi:hypothetical protein PCE1_004903 [Barthelona sp. PCE]
MPTSPSGLSSTTGSISPSSKLRGGDPAIQPPAFSALSTQELRVMVMNVPFMKSVPFLQTLFQAFLSYAPHSFDVFEVHDIDNKIRNKFSTWNSMFCDKSFDIQYSSLLETFYANELGFLLTEYYRQREVIRPDLRLLMLESVSKSVPDSNSLRSLFCYVSIIDSTQRGMLGSLFTALNSAVLEQPVHLRHLFLDRLTSVFSSILFNLPPPQQGITAKQRINGKDPRSLGKKCVSLMLDAFFTVEHPDINVFAPKVETPKLDRPEVPFIILEDESIFFGQLDDDGLPHGLGLCISKDHNTVQRAVFSHGVMHGMGIEVQTDVTNPISVFIGTFVNNEKRGIGRELRATNNGNNEFQFYEGQFHGVSHGKGRLLDKNGIYEGKFSENKPNGRGAMINRDGSRYVGSFLDGVPNGTGTLHTNDGQFMKGTSINGKFNGTVNIIDRSGMEEESNFDENVREGIYARRTQSGRFEQGVALKGKDFISHKTDKPQQ